MGEVSHSQGGRLSGTVVGAVEEVEAARGTAVEAGPRVAQQSVPLGAEIPDGLSEQEGEPQVVSRVPTVETVEPDSRKNLGQWNWTRQRGESCPHQKLRVERRSGGLWRDQGSGSLCDQMSSQGRHTG
jgi:hypothetical protein